MDCIWFGYAAVSVRNPRARAWHHLASVGGVYREHRHRCVYGISAARRPQAAAPAVGRLAAVAESWLIGADSVVTVAETEAYQHASDYASASHSPPGI